MTTVETLDARLSVGLYKHRKIKKLVAQIGFEGPWRLVGLWLYARESRPNGVLHGMTGEDIELEVDWAGAKGAFVAALVECKWLDKDGDTFVLHDWAEHQPFASNAQARKDSARLAGLIRQYGERKGREMFHVDQAASQRPASDPLATGERPASEASAPSKPSFLPSLPKATETPRKRGSRLPQPFALSPEWNEAARVAAEGMGKQLAAGQISLEFNKFCDHWWAKSGKDATKDDWMATWRNWIRKAIEFGAPVTNPPPAKIKAPDCNVPGCKREGMPGLGGVCEQHYVSPRRVAA